VRDKAKPAPAKSGKKTLKKSGEKKSGKAEDINQEKKQTIPAAK